MPRIRCTNVFYKGDYPVTLFPPPRILAPSLGLGTTWVRQPRSGSCHHPTAATKCNEQPSQATANPVGGKACSFTKDGLLHYILNTNSIHKLSSLKFAYYYMPLLRCTNVFPREAIPSQYDSICFTFRCRCLCCISVRIRI